MRKLTTTKLHQLHRPTEGPQSLPTRLAPDIETAEARAVFDAKNFLAFPGCVDGHMHIGIYQPLALDAVSESKAAAMGGVTSSLNYIRTGQYYLNRGGPYRDFMAEALKQSDGRFWVDYGSRPLASRSRSATRPSAAVVSVAAAIGLFDLGGPFPPAAVTHRA